MGEEQHRWRWVDNFKEFLNRPAGTQDPPDISPATKDLDIESNTLTRDQIRMTIRELKHGKVAGPNDIPCEADIETTVNIYPLFVKI